ncbi:MULTISPECIES: hypothetical protein [Geobacillus]|uniref:hypothetical protein n=1 Tax=Geobacillus TaxID=129337 RepID=UPI0009BE8D09|nr:MULTISPECIES: hypothetical protein [Geobacillus]NNV06218.1 hypothetical protein [Geobacillus sp. MMMUD3]MED3732548.1 hypothetical protein [Geobacillus stearothermophilus]MED3740120.1 hypothetical protein [Geobacillus stearothermophilus]MED3765975.1 hypothetical protein [Geobacillus stearothermophilus]MED3773724.1 hypothetical protein [Geobacillus stearothermophilus]
MSNFKTYAERDLSAFFNIDEFADSHDIDGQQVLAIIDSDQFDERPRDPVDLYRITDGIYRAALTIYVRSSDYAKPVIGQKIYVDGEDYYVSAVSEDAGVLKITVTANEG